MPLTRLQAHLATARMPSTAAAQSTARKRKVAAKAVPRAGSTPKRQHVETRQTSLSIEGSFVTEEQPSTVIESGQGTVSSVQLGACPTSGKFPASLVTISILQVNTDGGTNQKHAVTREGTMTPRC